ncbi:phosphoribosylanthranilate isomerase [Dyadobacter jejuensis]|uniref:Phosphoribosylanthranilate isomerase n=1 Tax=Dyadobacter jejuensis TaxID=1082580 RepID=A0A316AK47_9BACT|nr:hypothetical protein [Dyadobacter jejuensis]PWJ57220.1 phosphoribosylanthranilate isomerase [Dyadobacter jejuensis]
MLSKTVKISHVTNLSDARYCAGMGVEMLGFDIDEASIHYVTPKVFGELSAWIAGVKLVAETSSSDLTSILERIAEYPVDALEITDPALLQNLSSQTNLPLLLRVDADLYGPSDLELMVERYGDMVSHFLLISNEGSALNDEWMNTFTTLSKEHSLLVGFGLDHEYSVAALTELLPTIGIALRGSEEIRPGFKDFGSMMDILEALEED